MKPMMPILIRPIMKINRPPTKIPSKTDYMSSLEKMVM